MKILCIIDMQAKFEAANDERTIQNVIGLVNEWRERGWPVMVVEYLDFDDWTGKHAPPRSPTVQPIMDALNGYNYMLVHKTGDDGSEEIVDRMFEDGLGAITELSLCGVNSDACVRYTAEGLAAQGFEVEVIAKACNCYGGNNRNPWHKFRTTCPQNVTWLEVA